MSAIDINTDTYRFDNLPVVGGRVTIPAKVVRTLSLEGELITFKVIGESGEQHHTDIVDDRGRVGIPERIRDGAGAHEDADIVIEG